MAQLPELLFEVTEDASKVPVMDAWKGWLLT